MTATGPVTALRAALLGGGVALVPTDTVYGLAAALQSPDGVAAMYALKGRPRSQPCQVLVYTRDQLAAALGPLDPRTAAAAGALLPGPVTCIVPDPGGRYAEACGDRPGSVGIRAPRMDGPIATLDIPLVATSANEPGEGDPAVLADVPERIRAAVATRLDAGRLPGTASAVVDVTGVGAGGPARLLRPGSDPSAVAARLRQIGVGLESG